MKQLSTATRNCITAQLHRIYFGGYQSQQCERFHTWVKKKKKKKTTKWCTTKHKTPPLHWEHHQKQTPRTTRSSKRDHFESKEERRFRLNFSGMSRVATRKRKFPEMWGWKEKAQIALPPARNSWLRSRGRKIGRKEEKLEARKGKRRVAGRILSRKKPEGGARRDRQRWRGNQRGMGELAGSRQGLLWGLIQQKLC